MTKSKGGFAKTNEYSFGCSSAYLRPSDFIQVMPLLVCEAISTPINLARCHLVPAACSRLQLPQQISLGIFEKYIEGKLINGDNSIVRPVKKI